MNKTGATILTAIVLIGVLGSLLMVRHQEEQKRIGHEVMILPFKQTCRELVVFLNAELEKGATRDRIARPAKTLIDMARAHLTAQRSVHAAAKKAISYQ